MGGPGGLLVMLFLFALVAMWLLSFLFKRHPQFLESAIGLVYDIAVGGFWLAIIFIVVVVISVPLAGMLDLDREEQMLTWPFIYAALYLLGKRFK
ncbi:MAG: hypothetical protein CME80_08305 [Halomonas sp.]|nr:hypothetical protein [Halomonas sp.]MBF57705.1 hypothetical protein [Halomonas sp.]|tara:strand:- start:13158 stop:13442 length:285 start_codon:yes stop_codon:yes gene_type:complete